MPELPEAETVVRQLREPVRKRLLELPAGTLEEGEEPLASARRELEEEVGLVGGRWRELAAFYTTPGFCRERMHLLATIQEQDPCPKCGRGRTAVVARLNQRRLRMPADVNS